MKKILFLAAVATVCACGGRSNEVKELTIEEQVEAVLTHYFETKAIDCSVVSVQCVDTLYGAMPEDDPHYLALAAKRDSLKAISDNSKALSLRSGYNQSESLRKKAINDKVAVWDAETEMVDYKIDYKGTIEAYLYSVIVKSDSYELKKDVEKLWYSLSADHSKLLGVTSPEVLKAKKDVARFDEYDKFRF